MSNEKMENILKNSVPEELSDDALDAVSGGTSTDTVVTVKYRPGSVVIINPPKIEYCSSCGILLNNYEATITDIRGILDGVPAYWITRKCCGFETSVMETDILHRV